jgi:hypothetical protein
MPSGNPGQDIIYVFLESADKMERFPVKDIVRDCNTFFNKLPPYIMGGFDLTIHSNASEDDTTRRPRRKGNCEYIFLVIHSGGKKIEVCPQIFDVRL